LAFVAVFFISFFTGGIKINPGEDSIKIDTTYIDRVVTLPGRVDTFYVDKPVPYKVYDSDREREYLDLKTENERLKKYLEETKVRLYSNIYKSNDSLVTVKTTDSVRGTLLNQTVKIDIKEQKIEYKERVITKTFTKRPVFSLSTGFGVTTKYGSYNASSFEVNIGLKNKSGFEVELGLNTNKQIRVGLKKDLFTIYN